MSSTYGFLPYLAKGCRLDFNNGLRGDFNSGPFFGHRRSFKSDSNNSPPRPSQSCVRWSYICSCLLIMVSWQGLYLAKDCRPDFNNGLRGDLNSGLIYAPGVYWSLTRIMAPPQAISILSYICSCRPLMVSWQVPYLAKGCRLDFNNGLRGDSNSGPIYPRHLFESASNNGPSPGHLNVRWSYICSCLLPMVSWQVPYLAKGCRPDFNNGLRGDSNSGPILAPSVYLSLTRIMAIPRPFQY